MNIEMRHLRYFVAVASSEAFSARPGIVFVPSRGVPMTSLCVAWRADDLRPAVLGFVKVAASAGGGGPGGGPALRGIEVHPGRRGRRGANS